MEHPESYKTLYTQAIDEGGRTFTRSETPRTSSRRVEHLQDTGS
jgi:hypothetical protein